MGAVPAATPREPWSKRTKIVATLGPASADPRVIENMIDGGVNAFRINASHSDPEMIEALALRVRHASTRRRTPVGLILDLQGPKIRVGEVIGGQAELRSGSEFLLTSSRRGGDGLSIGINNPAALRSLKPGDRVLIDDGALRLLVEEARPGSVRTVVEVGGILRSRKGVNLPGAELDLPSLTAKDRRDVKLALKLGVDWIALSFIRSAADLRALKRFIKAQGGYAPVIAKIEKSEALTDLDAIIDACDALMVARGDLGIECPLEDIPIIQKDLIRRSVRAGKPVITATQMLESMIEHPIPTRAEATDVANAIFDQTDAVMLSGETAMGAYPVETVRIMARIIARTEKDIPYERWLEDKGRQAHEVTTEAIGYSACTLAESLHAAAIVAPTESGFTARQISKFRPAAPIIAGSPNEEVINRLSIVWGVFPRRLARPRSVDELFRLAAQEAKQSGFVASGQRIIITAGVKTGREPAVTNTIKVHVI